MLRLSGVVTLRCGPMPLFHHDRDEQGPAAPDPTVDPTRWQSTLAHYQGLSFTERAAEVLSLVGPALADGAKASAGTLLAPFLAPIHNGDFDPPQDEWIAAVALEDVLQDAFQMLVFGRLVRRSELEYKGATEINYSLSSDGAAALGAGNAADVLARRLPG